MEKVPFDFDTPVPKYFRDNGLFNNVNTLLFVIWAFSKCKLHTHTVFLDGQEVVLEPFEFSAGRQKSSVECFLSEKQFRIQLDFLINIGLLRKGANSKRNRFNTYIWNIQRFKSDPQDTTRPTRGQVGANPPEKPKKTDPVSKKGPTEKANLKLSQPIDFQVKELALSEVMNNESPSERPTGANSGPTRETVKDIASKGILPFEPGDQGQPSCAGMTPVCAKYSYFKSNTITLRVLEDELRESQSVNSIHSTRGLTDFFSSENLNSVNVSEENPTDDTPRIHIYQNVYMTQKELDECIKIKGNRAAVTYAVEYIMRSPGRKQTIRNWPHTLMRWEIRTDVKPRIVEHEEMAKRVEAKHGEKFDKSGWKAYIYRDLKKDQRGLLFESSSPFLEPIFLPFVDLEFKQKLQKTLKDKQMQLSRITE